jgi:hypothetical protein
MPRRFYVLGLLVGLHLGCAHPQVEVAAPPEPAPYQQFVAPNFDWSSVKRVVLMPMANQTAFAHASVEMQDNLAAEIQRAGRFDIVVATHEDNGARAREVFSRGSFDELELLRIAREYDAQAVLFGNLTQYHAYAPPRVGLSLIMICPAEGVAIASADGLWDARELTTARQAQAYLQHKLSWRQGLLGVDRALESPDVYQRFVCQQIATAMNPPEGRQIPQQPGQFSPMSPQPLQPQVAEQSLRRPSLSAIPSGVVPAGYEAPATDSAANRRPRWPWKFNPHSR